MRPLSPGSTWTADPELRRRLGRRAQQLAAALAADNLVEAVVAIFAGVVR